MTWIFGNGGKKEWGFEGFWGWILGAERKWELKKTKMKAIARMGSVRRGKI